MSTRSPRRRRNQPAINAECCIIGPLWLNVEAREAEHADATGGFLSVRRSEILSGFSRAAALLLLHNLPQDRRRFRGFRTLQERRGYLVVTGSGVASIRIVRPILTQTPTRVFGAWARLAQKTVLILRTDRICSMAGICKKGMNHDL